MSGFVLAKVATLMAEVSFERSLFDLARAFVLLGDFAFVFVIFNVFVVFVVFVFVVLDIVIFVDFGVLLVAGEGSSEEEEEEEEEG